MKRFMQAATLLIVAAVLTPSIFASPATDAFERLKALAGTWDITNDGAATGQGTYEVVSDGSVVLERALGMTTTYYLDNDILMAVHYCSAHNQPRFAAVGQTSPANLIFEVVAVSGLNDPNDGHMAKLSLSFDGFDQFTQSWTWRENGTDDAPEVFTYKRHSIANH